MSNRNLDEKKELPFNTERLLRAVEESSKRSRVILLIMTFASLTVFIALFNSFTAKFNWFKSKVELHKVILNHFYFASDSLNGNDGNISLCCLSNYYTLNENQFNKKIDSLKLASLYFEADRKKMYQNIRIKPPAVSPILIEDINKRYEKYKLLRLALDYMTNHGITDRPSFTNLVNQLDYAQVEHFDIVKVPILGITFHINYLGIYGGFVFTVLYFLFYFSLLREKINLKITFKRGWVDLKQHHYYLYEYASMLQVLSIPKKLFTNRKKRNFTFLVFSKFTILMPLIVYAILFFYDVYTADLGNETNQLMTFITIAFDFFFLLTIIIYYKKVHHQWKTLDSLWDDQTLEFNFEYILEALGIDTKDKALVKLFPTNLKVSDLPQVKQLWFSIVENQKNTKSVITKKESMRLLSIFSNEVFDIPLKRESFVLNINKTEQIELAWNPLVEWFNTKGTRNATSDFRSTFYDKLTDILNPKTNDF